MKKFIPALSLAFSLTIASGIYTQAGAQVIKDETKTSSHKGKDAAIGAGVGAATGAIISKHNRGSGALIGGAIGAGAGYLHGRHKDKKNPPATIHKTKRIE